MEHPRWDQVLALAGMWPWNTGPMMRADPSESVWRGLEPDVGHSLGLAGTQVPWWTVNQPSPVKVLPYAYMEHLIPLGDHLLPTTKIKIQKSEYIDSFMLLFHDTEVKERTKDNSKEQEKNKHRQVDKNFAI